MFHNSMHGPVVGCPLTKGASMVQHPTPLFLPFLLRKS